MVDRLVAVDDADYRLPEPVLQAIGADVGDSETYIGEALSAAYSPLGGYFAAPSGGDDTVAVQAALDATTGDKITRLTGVYTITSTLYVRGNLDASGAVINYSGSGIAVQVGVVGGTLMQRKRVVLPRIVYTPKPSKGWVSGTVGVRFVNLYSCAEIFIPHVQGFEVGMLVAGEGQGNVHNTYNVGQLDNNKVNQRLDPSASGWVNSNIFLGGRFSHPSSEGPGPVEGVTQIHIASGPNPVNNNVWVNPSLESANIIEWAIDHENGSYNQWIAPRMENSATAQVRWGAGATNNFIQGGYGTAQVAFTKVSGAVRNSFWSVDLSEQQGSGSNGVFRWENSGSSGAPVVCLYPAGTFSAAYSASADWQWSWAANALKAKAKADTNERLRVDATTGRAYFGTGSAAPTTYVTNSFSSVAIGGGGLLFLTDNTYDVGQSANYRPRYVRAGTAVQTGAFATGSRPSASTAGAGATIFDTTLGKPIWSNGTGWVDATGTAV